MKLQKVDCRYGAPMGRREIITARALAVKFHLARVRINAGGYDAARAYWGIGAPLYRAWGETPPVINVGYYGLAGEPEQIFYLRAGSRDAAKAEVLRMFPRATFYR